MNPLSIGEFIIDFCITISWLYANHNEKVELFGCCSLTS